MTNVVCDECGLTWADPVLDGHPAVAEVERLRKTIRRVLDLRSSFEADRGNDRPLVVNLQAREMLERALEHGMTERGRKDA